MFPIINTDLVVLLSFTRYHVINCLLLDVVPESTEVLSVALCTCNLFLLILMQKKLYNVSLPFILVCVCCCC